MVENHPPPSKQLVVESLIGKVYSDFDFTLTHDQAILYSLATGCADNQLASINNLSFLYEKEGDF